jgi:hypothetical protein
MTGGSEEASGAKRPGNVEKDPDDWITGDESMTGAQASYLQTLCEEAGEPFDAKLTKAEASKRIDELQARTGRGRIHPDRAVSGTQAAQEEPQPSSDRLEDLFGYARAHAATGDTRVWIDDLERMLLLAWDLMTNEQRRRFREHPDIAALIEAAGQSPVAS